MPATLRRVTPDDPLEIPLFPLPSVVLFPLATVPLFVFEPRYRQMMESVLQGASRRIGMVAVAESHREEMGGDPPVLGVGCEGEVTAAERNEDGTWRVLLQGTRRFRIVEERPPEGERLYRVAHVETLPDIVDAEDRASMRAGRAELLGLLSDLIRRTSPEHARAFDPERFDGIEEDRLVNVLAQGIDLDFHDKQQLLEVDRVRDRRHILCELLRFRIATLDVGTGGGPQTLH